MKLIYCPKCQDVVRLISTRRLCECGESYGYYINDINAVIEGKAIPIGIENTSFAKAIAVRPDAGPGSRFTAFVISKKCPTVKEKE